MSARVLVTTRAVGNLALHVADDPDAVAENRRRLARMLGVEHVQFMHQVHGSEVAVVDTVSALDVSSVDGLVTATPGLAVAVLVADCVPVAVVGEHAVGVAHAGRSGVRAGVVPALVAALRRLDTGPLTARLGASVCGRCYEVPAEMQRDVCSVVPEARSTTRQGTPALDLRAAVRAQLLAAGVRCDEQSAADPPCTLEDPAYFSHRRDGVTGRFALVAMLAS